MKYYCKNCGSVFEIDGHDMFIRFGGYGHMRCPCGKRQFDVMPVYETPAQYKKRTGKAFPDEGAVWFKRNDGKPFIDGGYWGICRYKTAKRFGDRIIVIADPPVPPPNDRRPPEVSKC